MSLPEKGSRTNDSSDLAIEKFEPIPHPRFFDAAAYVGRAIMQGIRPGKIEAYGIENVLDIEGAAIIAPIHVDAMDIVAAGWPLSRHSVRPVYYAKEEMMQNWLKIITYPEAV